MTIQSRGRIRPLGLIVAGCLIVAAAVVGVRVLVSNSPGAQSSAAPGSTAPSYPGLDGVPVCGQPVLESPYSYDGPPGSYPSGTARLPTYGGPHTDFPQATAGVVLPTGAGDYLSYQLKPDTVYYLLPGEHSGSIQADQGDAFVGGRSNGVPSVLNGNYSSGGQAIDSNETNGDQSGVTIEYLTIEKYQPHADAAAINQEANTDWTIQYNTITLNVPGAGIMAGTGNTLKDNCLTLNGQYGFQSSDTNGFGADSLTHGPYNVTIAGNEISYNDTCDFSGLLDNPAIGWKNYNPVPQQYRNPECGVVVGDGNQGGFKLWQTNGVTVEDNYIHHNWGPGGWADTDNANTTWRGNTITDNENAAIIEEISYNFSITGNRIAGNDWIDGLGNSNFPQPAIYISASGSDTTFGGIPACQEPSCAHQPSYSAKSVISGNQLTDNGGGIFLWQDANRYCSDGTDGACTLVDGGTAGPFTLAGCKQNISTAAVDTSRFRGQKTGARSADWWDGCLWKTENVLVASNTINFNPAQIAHCVRSAWPDCGANGIFSEYGSPPNGEPGWVIATALTFWQGNQWRDNLYNGPSTFYAWNQGNGDNPVSWASWTADPTAGAVCQSSGQRQSGYCDGPFGQDAGSTYHA